MWDLKLGCGWVLGGCAARLVDALPTALGAHLPIRKWDEEDIDD